MIKWTRTIRVDSKRRRGASASTGDRLIVLCPTRQVGRRPTDRAERRSCAPRHVYMPVTQRQCEARGSPTGLDIIDPPRGGDRRAVELSRLTPAAEAVRDSIRKWPAGPGQLQGCLVQFVHREARTPR